MIVLHALVSNLTLTLTISECLFFVADSVALEFAIIYTSSVIADLIN